MANAIGGEAKLDEILLAANVDASAGLDKAELKTAIEEFFKVSVKALNDNKTAIDGGESPAGFPCHLTDNTSGCASGN